MFSYSHKKYCVESLIHSIATGAVKIKYVSPESELFVHQCQYYLRLLDQGVLDTKRLGMLDKTILDLFDMLFIGRLNGWLVGITQRIDHHEPMNYFLNSELILTLASKE